MVTGRSVVKKFENHVLSHIGIQCFSLPRISKERNIQMFCGRNQAINEYIRILNRKSGIPDPFLRVLLKSLRTCSLKSARTEQTKRVWHYSSSSIVSISCIHTSTFFESCFMHKQQNLSPTSALSSATFLKDVHSAHKHVRIQCKLVQNVTCILKIYMCWCSHSR